MHAKKRLKRLNSVIAIRLSAEHAAGVLERAQRAGQTSSEWCRGVLLHSLETAADTKLLLAEVLAARKIFLALHLDALQGELKTKERVFEAIESADTEKFIMAERRIHEFRRAALNGQK